MSSGYRNFQDEEVKPSSGRGGGEGRQAVNPYNANIVKGGGVNPSSSLYQRSIAGRQKLDVYLKDLWDKGGDEKDVFMAGVNSLMQRGHGYVGAYLDSKNPGRQYTRNEAMAITDQVMTNAGIGEHPGARLTGAGGETDEEKAAAKEKRKSDREARGEASKYGPQMDTGRKAMPVGQQRKIGKRPSTGVPAEPGDREGIGRPDTSGTNRDAGPGMSKALRWQDDYAKWLPGYEKWKQEYTDGIKQILDARDKKEITAEQAADQISKLNSKNKEFRQQQKDFITRAQQEKAESSALPPEIQKQRDKNRERRALDRAGVPGEEEAGGGAPGEEILPIEGKVKQDLAREYQNIFKTTRDGMINKKRRDVEGGGKIWDKNNEKYINPDEGQIREIIDLAIDNVKDIYGNIDEQTARDLLRKNAINSLGIDPYGDQESVAQPPAEEQQQAPGTAAQPPAEEQQQAPAAPETAAQPPVSGGQVDQQVVQDIMEAGAKSPSVEEFKKEIMRQGHFRDIQGGAKTMGPSTTATAMAGQQATAKRKEAKAVKELNRSVSPQSKIDRFKQDPETGQWQRKGRKPAQPKQKGFDLENLPAWEPDKTPIPKKQPPAPEPQQPPAPEQEPPAPQKPQQPAAPGQQAPAPQQPQQQQAKKPGGQGFNRPAQQAPKPGVKRKSTFLDDVARAVQGGVDRFQTGMEKDRAARQAFAKNLSGLLNRVGGGKFSEYEEMSYEEFAQAVRSIIR